MARSAAAAPSRFPADALLGGPGVLSRRPRTVFDWVAIIREGLASGAIEALAGHLRLSQGELATTLGIPERTLARRKKEGRLTSEESAKLIRVARVFERAQEVFEDADAAIDWLKSANRSLSAERPLSLLDTDIGAESVMDALGRIAHGVYA